MATAPQQFIDNSTNALTDAELVASSTQGVVDAAISIPTTRVGNASIELTGSFTGEDEALFDIVVLDSDATDNPLLSTPTFRGIGSGSMAVGAVTGTAQSFTATLTDLGNSLNPASVLFEGVHLIALTAGNGGNDIAVTVDYSTLTFSPSGFSLLADLTTSSSNTYVGNEFDWDTQIMDSSGNIPATAHRLAFSDDLTRVYRQYKHFTAAHWGYSFEPPIEHTVKKSAEVLFVTGGVKVTITNGATTEDYNDIVNLYDLFTAINATSALVRVEGVITDDYQPNGQAVTEVTTHTDPYALASQGTGTAFATGFTDVVINDNASTELIEARCIAATKSENPDAYLGHEIWELKGSVSGLLEGTLITDVLFTQADNKFSLKIPKKLPTDFTVGGDDNITVVSQNFPTDDTKRGGATPPVCIRSKQTGSRVVGRSITLTYKKRAVGASCECGVIPLPELSTQWLNGEVPAIPQSGAYPMSVAPRIRDAFSWRAAKYKCIYDGKPDMAAERITSLLAAFETQFTKIINLLIEVANAPSNIIYRWDEMFDDFKGSWQSTLDLYGLCRDGSVPVMRMVVRTIPVAEDLSIAGFTIPAASTIVYFGSRDPQGILPVTVDYTYNGTTGAVLATDLLTQPLQDIVCISIEPTTLTNTKDPIVLEVEAGMVELSQTNVIPATPWFKDYIQSGLLSGWVVGSEAATSEVDAQFAFVDTDGKQYFAYYVEQSTLVAEETLRLKHDTFTITGHTGTYQLPADAVFLGASYTSGNSGSVTEPLDYAVLAVNCSVYVVDGSDLFTITVSPSGYSEVYDGEYYISYLVNSADTSLPKAVIASADNPTVMDNGNVFPIGYIPLSHVQGLGYNPYTSTFSVIPVTGIDPSLAAALMLYRNFNEAEMSVSVVGHATNGAVNEIDTTSPKAKFIFTTGSDIEVGDVVNTAHLSYESVSIYDSSLIPAKLALGTNYELTNPTQGTITILDLATFSLPLKIVYTALRALVRDHKTLLQGDGHTDLVEGHQTDLGNNIRYLTSNPALVEDTDYSLNDATGILTILANLDPNAPHSVTGQEVATVFGEDKTGTLDFGTGFYPLSLTITDSADNLITQKVFNPVTPALDMANVTALTSGVRGYELVADNPVTVTYNGLSPTAVTTVTDSVKTYELATVTTGLIPRFVQLSANGGESDTPDAGADLSDWVGTFERTVLEYYDTLRLKHKDITSLVITDGLGRVIPAPTVYTYSATTNLVTFTWEDAVEDYVLPLKATYEASILYAWVETPTYHVMPRVYEIVVGVTHLDITDSPLSVFTHTTDQYIDLRITNPMGMSDNVTFSDANGTISLSGVADWWEALTGTPYDYSTADTDTSYDVAIGGVTHTNLIYRTAQLIVTPAADVEPVGDFVKVLNPLPVVTTGNVKVTGLTVPFEDTPTAPTVVLAMSGSGTGSAVDFSTLEVHYQGVSGIVDIDSADITIVTSETTVTGAITGQPHTKDIFTHEFVVSVNLEPYRADILMVDSADVHTRPNFARSMNLVCTALAASKVVSASTTGDPEDIVIVYSNYLTRVIGTVVVDTETFPVGSTDGVIIHNISSAEATLGSGTSLGDGGQGGRTYAPWFGTHYNDMVVTAIYDVANLDTGVVLHKELDVSADSLAYVVNLYSYSVYVQADVDALAAADAAANWPLLSYQGVSGYRIDTSGTVHIEQHTTDLAHPEQPTDGTFRVEAFHYAPVTQVPIPRFYFDNNLWTNAQSTAPVLELSDWTGNDNPTIVPAGWFVAHPPVVGNNTTLVAVSNPYLLSGSSTEVGLLNPEVFIKGLGVPTNGIAVGNYAVQVMRNADLVYQAVNANAHTLALFDFNVIDDALLATYLHQSASVTSYAPFAAAPNDETLPAGIVVNGYDFQKPNTFNLPASWTAESDNNTPYDVLAINRLCNVWDVGVKDDNGAVIPKGLYKLALRLKEVDMPYLVGVKQVLPTTTYAPPITAQNMVLVDREVLLDPNLSHFAKKSVVNAIRKMVFTVVIQFTAPLPSWVVLTGGTGLKVSYHRQAYEAVNVTDEEHTLDDFGATKRTSAPINNHVDPSLPVTAEYLVGDVWTTIPATTYSQYDDTVSVEVVDDTEYAGNWRISYTTLAAEGQSAQVTLSYYRAALNFTDLGGAVYYNADLLQPPLDTGGGGTGVTPDTFLPFEERVSAYNAWIDEIRVIAGKLYAQLPNAASDDLLVGGWADTGAPFYWEVATSLDIKRVDDTLAGRYYAPAFTNEPYYASVPAEGLVDAADPFGGTVQATLEFGFIIECVCESRLLEGDTITLAIGDSGWPSTYKTGDTLTLPIISASPLSLAGGTDGDNVQTWAVSGSVVGDLPDYSLDKDLDNAYLYSSSFDLGFTIHQGSVPFGVGDKFTFNVEGGHIAYRVDGGSYSAPITVTSALMLLESGISASVSLGSAPSLVADDVYSFTVLQPYAVQNALTPTREAWVFGDDAIVTLTADLGSVKSVSGAALAYHTLPATATVLVDGYVANVLMWSEYIVVTKGVAVTLFEAVDADKLVFTFEDANNAKIGWIWAGLTNKTDSAAEVTLSRDYSIKRAGSSAQYYGRAVSGQIDWKDACLYQADVTMLQALFDYVKENDDEPFILVPHEYHVEEAVLAKIVDDQIEFREEFNYQPDSKDDRRFTTSIKIKGEIFT